MVFKNFALHRVKSANAKRDSGGVRNKYADFVSMHKSDSDDSLWLKLSGHLLSCQNDVYICLTYIVPENSSRNVFITTSVYAYS
mgnify:CR=1 FL=1